MVEKAVSVALKRKDVTGKKDEKKADDLQSNY